MQIMCTGYHYKTILVMGIKKGQQADLPNEAHP